jgi:hypothetical protein
MKRLSAIANDYPLRSEQYSDSSQIVVAPAEELEKGAGVTYRDSHMLTGLSNSGDGDQT